MVKVIDDNFMVCTDCLMMIANGDSSGIAEEDYDRVMQGLDSIESYDCCGENQAYPVCGDSEKDEEFSTRDCECCGSYLAGSRHHCVILEN